MKNKIKLITLVIAMALTNINVMAQFDSAIVAEDYIQNGISAMPRTIGTHNTGNDILSLSGDTYEVTVWDDTTWNSFHAGIGWKVTFNGITYLGWDTLHKNRQQPYDCDVAIVTDSSADTVYAMVVYFGTYDTLSSQNRGRWSIEYWMWDTIANKFVVIEGGDLAPCGYTSSCSTSASFTPFGTSINIDGERNNYVIAFDDSAGNIYGMTGTIVDTLPGLNNNGAIILVAHGRYPDVSINNVDDSNRVYFAYVDTLSTLDQHGNPILTYENLKVDYCAFDTLRQGISLANASVIRFESETQGGTRIRYPRIASPRNGSAPNVASGMYINGNQTVHVDDFTVVWEEAAWTNGYPEDYAIYGLNRCHDCDTTHPGSTTYGSSSTPEITYIQYNHVYSVGYSYSPYDIWDVPNTRPVVTYDYDANHVWVGWEFDNNNIDTVRYPPYTGVSSMLRATYPIVMKCDPKAQPIDSITSMPSEYLVVPVDYTTNSNGTLYDASPSHSLSHSLSIAGRNNSDCLYSFYFEGGNPNRPDRIVYTKSVAQSNSVLRLAFNEGQTNIESYEVKTLFGIVAIPEGTSITDYIFNLNLYDISGKNLVQEKGNIYRLEEVYKSISDIYSEGIYVINLRSEDNSINLNSKMFVANNNR